MSYYISPVRLFHYQSLKSISRTTKGFNQLFIHCWTLGHELCLLTRFAISRPVSSSLFLLLAAAADRTSERALFSDGGGGGGGGRCRTTTWRLRAWSGTKNCRPSPTPAPVATSSRLPRTTSGSGRRSPDAQAAPFTSPSSTTRRISWTTPNPAPLLLSPDPTPPSPSPKSILSSMVYFRGEQRSNFCTLLQSIFCIFLYNYHESILYYLGRYVD